MQANPFIGIVGNIGAGKSTLTQMLADRFGWKPFFEANAENPYLEDFYQDMRRWGFHSQIFFLSTRLEHHRALTEYAGGAVQDRTVYEDSAIFARNLYNQGHLTDREYEAYCRLYQSIVAFLPHPTLLIYLAADVDTLLEHIRHRGRAFEQNMDRQYLQQLNDLYESWIADWDQCPVVRIEMAMRDFQHNRRDFDEIIQQVEAMLSLV